MMPLSTAYSPRTAQAVPAFSRLAHSASKGFPQPGADTGGEGREEDGAAARGRGTAEDATGAAADASSRVVALLRRLAGGEAKAASLAAEARDVLAQLNGGQITPPAPQAPPPRMRLNIVV